MKLAVALLAALSCVAARGEELRLTLTALTPEVVAGAPILLRATVEAKGGSAAAAVPAISPAAGNFELWVANLVTGERTRYLGPGWSEEPRGGALQAAPATTVLRLLSGRERSGLPFVPARWQFNIQYTGLGADRPLYGQATVTVREPHEGDEQAWWKALRANPALAEAIQSGAASGAAAEGLEALVRAHGSAAQANAAALAVGRYYLETRKEPAKALEFLRVAGGPTADSLTRREAMLAAADALEATGARHDAESVRKQVEAAGTGAPVVARPAPATGPAPTVGPVKQP